MPGTLNIAHRGGAGLWPENTVFAFACAAKAGFDGAELDVQLTRDGGLAVFHDFRLNPEICRDRHGRWLRGKLPLVHDLTLAELQEYDAGRPKPGSAYARRHPKLRPSDGARIPALSEVIAAVQPHRAFRLFIEVKTSAEDPSLSAPPEAVAEAVVEELRASRFADRAVLVGFDWRGLIHAKRSAPEIPCWFTTGPHAPAAAEDIRRAGGDGWFCSRARADAAAVRDARAQALDFGVWTVNQARDMRALLSLGADAICTDRPDRLRSEQTSML